VVIAGWDGARAGSAGRGRGAGAGGGMGFGGRGSTGSGGVPLVKEEWDMKKIRTPGADRGGENSRGRAPKTTGRAHL